MFTFIKVKYIYLFLMLALLSSVAGTCSSLNPIIKPSETPLPSKTSTTTIQPTKTSTVTPIPTFTPTATLDPNIAPILISIAAGLVMHGPQDQKRVALTFDACEVPGQSAGFDTGIINILIQKEVKATFFLGGLWMENHPEAARLLGTNPLFEIGSHSYSHPDFILLSREEMDLELVRTQDIAWRLTGHVPTVFRPPFGTYNDAALQAAADHGLRTIQWDVETGDPDPNIDAETMLRYVKAQVKNGSIIIMHVNGRGWHSAEALPMVIDWLHNEGYELVTISELLGENK
jgi:peptidoglycan/xylan/chitin deacetylase (PgdA/CDA1 family)